MLTNEHLTDIVEKLKNKKTKIREKILENVVFEKDNIDNIAIYLFGQSRPRIDIIGLENGDDALLIYSSIYPAFSEKVKYVDSSLASVCYFKKCQDLASVICLDPETSEYRKECLETFLNIIEIAWLAFHGGVEYELHIRTFDMLANKVKNLGFHYCSDKESSEAYFMENAFASYAVEDYESTKEYFEKLNEFVSQAPKFKTETILDHDDIESKDAGKNYIKKGSEYINSTLFNVLAPGYFNSLEFFRKLSMSYKDYEYYQDYTVLSSILSCLGFEMNTFSKSMTVFEDSWLALPENLNLDKFYIDRINSTYVSNIENITDEQLTVFNSINSFINSAKLNSSSFINNMFGPEINEFMFQQKEFNDLFNKSYRNINVTYAKEDYEKSKTSSGGTFDANNFINIFNNYFRKTNINYFILKPEDTCSILLNSSLSTPRSAYFKLALHGDPQSIASPKDLDRFCFNTSMNETIEHLFNLLHIFKYFFNIEVESFNLVACNNAIKSKFNTMLESKNFFELVKNNYRRVDTTLASYDMKNKEVIKVNGLKIHTTPLSRIFFLRLCDLPDIVRDTEEGVRFTREGLTSFDVHIVSNFNELHKDYKDFATFLRYMTFASAASLTTYSSENHIIYKNIVENSKHNEKALGELLILHLNKVAESNSFEEFLNTDENTFRIFDISYFAKIYMNLANANNIGYKDNYWFSEKAVNDVYSMNGYIAETEFDVLRELLIEVVKKNREVRKEKFNSPHLHKLVNKKPTDWN